MHSATTRRSCSGSAPRRLRSGFSIVICASLDQHGETPGADPASKGCKCDQVLLVSAVIDRWFETSNQRSSTFAEPPTDDKPTHQTAGIQLVFLHRPRSKRRTA